MNFSHSIHATTESTHISDIPSIRFEFIQTVELVFEQFHNEMFPIQMPYNCNDINICILGYLHIVYCAGKHCMESRWLIPTISFAFAFFQISNNFGIIPWTLRLFHHFWRWICCCVWIYGGWISSLKHLHSLTKVSNFARA